MSRALWGRWAAAEVVQISEGRWRGRSAFEEAEEVYSGGRPVAAVGMRMMGIVAFTVAISIAAASHSGSPFPLVVLVAAVRAVLRAGGGAAVQSFIPTAVSRRLRSGCIIHQRSRAAGDSCCGGDRRSPSTR